MKNDPYLKIVSDAYEALDAIAEGYMFTTESYPGRLLFVRVDNPKYKPDDGSDPYLVFEIKIDLHSS